MALNSMYCVDVPLHAASGLFMFTLPPKRGTTRKHIGLLSSSRKVNGYDLADVCFIVAILRDQRKYALEYQLRLLKQRQVFIYLFIYWLSEIINMAITCKQA